MEQEAIMSTEVAALTEALSKAQGEFSNVKKNDEAKGAFSYKYANLADCLKEIRGVLSNHGMSFTQLVNHNKMQIMMMDNLQLNYNIHFLILLFD